MKLKGFHEFTSRGQTASTRSRALMTNYIYALFVYLSNDHKKKKTIEVQLLGRPLKETDSIRFYFWCISVKKMEYDECNTFNLYVILTKTLFSFASQLCPTFCCDVNIQ